jgi:hypothetical protein
VQVGTDEGRSEGWSEGIPDTVGAWELVGAELGALDVEGADELVGAEDSFIPFLLFPRFPALLFPLVGTLDGILEGRSDSIDETERARETVGDNVGALEVVGGEDVEGATDGHTDPLELPIPPFPPLPLNARPGMAPTTFDKRSDSKMMVVPVVVFMMKKRDVEKQ